MLTPDEFVGLLIRENSSALHLFLNSSATVWDYEVNDCEFCIAKTSQAGSIYPEDELHLESARHIDLAIDSAWLARIALTSRLWELPPVVVSARAKGVEWHAFPKQRLGDDSHLLNFANSLAEWGICPEELLMPFGNAMGHTWLAVANANASKPVFSCCVNHSSFAWRSLATQVRADSNWPEFESRLQTEDPVTPDECRFWFNVKTISLLCGTEISAAHSFMPNESWKHANKRLFTADLRGFNTLNLIATRLQSMS